MKKIILILLLSIFLYNNVYAKECSVNEMADLAKSLNDINYKLDYAKDLKDQGQEGYFYLVFDKMPTGYKAEVGNFNIGFYILDKPNVAAPLAGGIYKLNFFHDTCDFPIKTLEVRVPYYKNFCTSEDCKNDSWFDGTYENKNTDSDDEENEGKANKNLVIILIVLTVILTVLISLISINGRSKKDEEQS